MTNARSLIALAVLATSASLASAQASAPASRADVKADARAAVKAGTTDEGDLSKKEVQGGRVTKTEGGSSTSRSEVRSDAKQAVRTGTVAEGERGGPAYDDRDRQGAAKPTAGSATAATATNSSTSRSEVKANATSAISAPAGMPKTQNTALPVPPQSPNQTR